MLNDLLVEIPALITMSPKIIFLVKLLENTSNNWVVIVFFMLTLEKLFGIVLSPTQVN
jgi:hypothetical protein